MEFAAWQVAMERLHFSSGTIDGDFGIRCRRTIAHFQRSRDLPVTGMLDSATRSALGKPSEPFISYTITAEDMKKIQPTPKSWKAKAAATYLGYNDSWEMLAEKAHSTPKFIQTLNPQQTSAPEEGAPVVLPNLTSLEKLPPTARIRIILSETILLAYDASDNLTAAFPCSIAANKNKVPSGSLEVVVIAPNPNYTYNPEVFANDPNPEPITTKLIIPSGPRNPVGLAWIGLSQPGYGIHGTPDASAISRTGSHGCFRLANWNAVLLLYSLKRGVPVEVVE